MGIFPAENDGGLLSPEMQDQVNNQTLMALGLSLLQNSGYSATPQSLGQIVGQAGLGAMQQHQSLTDRAIEKALRGRQMAKEQSEEDRIKRARESASATVPETLREAFSADPETAINAAKLAEASNKQPNMEFVKDFKLPDGSTVSGYTSPETGFIPIGPAVAPDPTVDEKKQVLALRTAQDTLNNLQSTFSETGTELLPTVGKTQLKSQYRNLQLQLKELYNLGVLNGPDMGILEDVMLDPTSIGAGFNSNERVAESLNQVQIFIKNKEKALLQTPGVRAREGDSIVDDQTQVPLGLSSMSDDDLLGHF